MSKYKTIQTEYRSLPSLLQALTDLGITHELAPNASVPSLPLYGYRDDMRPERASLAIRRSVVNRWSGGASNDVGFAWNGQTFAAIVSEYDHNPGVTRMLEQIRQRYAYHELSRQAAARGYTLRQSAAADGAIRLTLTRR